MIDTKPKAKAIWCWLSHLIQFIVLLLTWSNLKLQVVGLLISFGHVELCVNPLEHLCWTSSRNYSERESLAQPKRWAWSLQKHNSLYSRPKPEEDSVFATRARPSNFNPCRLTRLYWFSGRDTELVNCPVSFSWWSQIGETPRNEEIANKLFVIWKVLSLSILILFLS